MPRDVGHTIVRARTILPSVLAHVALVVVIARCELDRTSTVAVAVPDPAPMIDLVPIEVAMIETAAPAGQAPVRTTGATATIGAPRRDVIATIAPPGEAVAPTTGEPVPNNQLGMRGKRHDLTLSTETAARIATGGGTAASSEAPTSEPRWSHDPKIKLLSQSGGSHEVRDRVATFRVARDGTVDIENVPDFSIELNLPDPTLVAKRFRRDFSRWAKDPWRDQRHGRMQDLPKHLTAVEGTCQSFTDSMCITSEMWQEQWALEDEGATTRKQVRGNLDITGWLHRKFVGDPYASRKLKVLDQTRDERVRTGGEYREEQLDRSAELMQKNLDAVWRTIADSAQRRSALFALWDECTEGDDTAGRSGDRARAMVIGAIRARLPAGSAGAFDAAEIAALDARRTSRQHFVPYD